MVFEQNNSIESLILRALKNGPVRTTDLIVLTKKQRNGTTKQGVYRVLRGLVKREVVVISKRYVNLNALWLNEMYDFFTVAEQSYSALNLLPDKVFGLTDGDRIQYVFKTPALTDTFWIHLLLMANKAIDPSDPLFLYNPHWWFAIAREKSELELIRAVKLSKRQFLLTVPNASALDKSMSNLFDGTMAQYYLSPKSLFKQNNYYLNIIGDILIEVWLDKILSEKIHDLYVKKKTTSVDLVKEMQTVIASGGKSKMIVSRNRSRSEAKKRLLRRFFYIPKEK